MACRSDGLTAGFRVGFVLLVLCSLFSVAAAQTCVQPPAGLVSWWPGDDNADDIQNGNDGTLQNGATFAAGMVGQAFSFDGVDDFVEVADSPSFTPSSLTLDAWVNPATLSTGVDGRVIVSKYNSNNPTTNGVSWLLRMQNLGHLRVTVHPYDWSTRRET
jgi:hypothetical protein